MRRCLAGECEEIAEYVCSSVSGLEWFACREHAKIGQQHIVGERVARAVPIAEWFASHGLPVPE